MRLHTLIGVMLCIGTPVSIGFIIFVGVFACISLLVLGVPVCKDVCISMCLVANTVLKVARCARARDFKDRLSADVLRTGFGIQVADAKKRTAWS